MNVHAIKSTPDPDPRTTPWANLPHVPLRRLGAKRLVDLVVGATALALAAPVIGLAIVAIKLTSRGPAIFKQERVGIHEHTFVLFKLRTMKTNNDDSEHRAYAIRLLTDPEAPAADAEGTFKLTRRPSCDASRQVSSAVQPRRASPARERLARRHGAGWAAAGAGVGSGALHRGAAH